MKYKVLIVDDETWTYELLKRIINWNDQGFEIVGYCKDGVTAYDFICANRPHIVISDIRMPEMDGIALIKKIRANKIPIRFILISGYQHFEYAKKALKYEVDDYLLKPIEEKELENTLNKISNALNKEQNESIKANDIQEKFNNSIGQLKVKTFESILFSINSEKQDINDINRICQMQLIPASFQISLLFIETENNSSTALASIINLKIKKLFNEIVSSKKCEYVLWYKDGLFILFINYSQEINLDSLYQHYYNDVSKMVNNYNKATTTLAIGDIVDNIDDISNSYNTALKYLRSQIIYGKNRIYGNNRMLAENKIIYSTISMNDILTISIKISLSNAFELLDFELAESIIKSIFDTIIDVCNIDPNVLYSTLEELLTTLWASFKKTGAEVNDFPIPFSLDSEIIQDENLDLLFQNILTFIKRVLAYYSERQEKALSKPVEHAKIYIKKNYSKQISLGQIAQYVYLSPHYLSELFKKETGITISDFIRAYRIEIAKKLLCDSNYRIKDIAGLSGYFDARHFSKIFKKMVGITPKEYKQLNLY